MISKIQSQISGFALHCYPQFYSSVSVGQVVVGSQYTSVMISGVLQASVNGVVEIECNPNCIPAFSQSDCRILSVNGVVEIECNPNCIPAFSQSDCRILTSMNNQNSAASQLFVKTLWNSELSFKIYIFTCLSDILFHCKLLSL